MRGRKSAGYWMINRTHERNEEDLIPAVIVFPDLGRGIAFAMSITFVIALSD